MSHSHMSAEGSASIYSPVFVDILSATLLSGFAVDVGVWIWGFVFIQLQEHLVSPGADVEMSRKLQFQFIFKGVMRTGLCAEHSSSSIPTSTHCV